MSAMEAWRFELPRDPKAWLLQTAKNRAIDRIRREQRFSALRPVLESEWALASTPDALSGSEDAKNQLAMMFSLCDEALSHETHVTLILRLLCGLSPAEIARAFLVGTETVERRLHRGRARLRALGRLDDATNPDEVARHQGSVMHALYLLFNEGYHGSDPENPLLPALCKSASPSCSSSRPRRRTWRCTRSPRCSASTPRACPPAWTTRESSCRSLTRIAAGGIARSSSAACSTCPRRPAAIA